MKKIILLLCLANVAMAADGASPSPTIQRQSTEAVQSEKTHESVTVVPPSPLEQDAGPSKSSKSKKSDKPHPCAMIERVCKEANFKEWISRDCVIPILKHQKVEGVKIDDISNQQIQACQMEKKLLHY